MPKQKHRKTAADLARNESARQAKSRKNAPAPGTKARGFRGPGGSGEAKIAPKSVAKKTDYAAEMNAAKKSGNNSAFYTAQRQRAVKTGDKSTLNKINSKIQQKAGLGTNFPSGTDPSSVASRALANMGSTRKQQAFQSGQSSRNSEPTEAKKKKVSSGKRVATSKKSGSTT